MVIHLQLLFVIFQGLLARIDRRKREEAGASVLEWALIAAVVVVAAAVIGTVITRIVNDKSAKLEECADGSC